MTSTPTPFPGGKGFSPRSFCVGEVGRIPCCPSSCLVPSRSAPSRSERVSGLVLDERVPLAERGRMPAEMELDRPRRAPVWLRLGDTCRSGDRIARGEDIGDMTGGGRPRRDRERDREGRSSSKPMPLRSGICTGPETKRAGVDVSERVRETRSSLALGCRSPHHRRRQPEHHRLQDGERITGGHCAAVAIATAAAAADHSTYRAT